MKASELIEFASPGLAPESVRVEIAHDDAPDATPAVIERWDAMRTEKPRLFNGPVLSYLGLDHGVVRARRDTYQRLAVQAHEPALVDPPVMQLSVTGVVTALDSAGTRHVLLGRRSHATRIYGGLWELGPSGGIDAPPPTRASLHGLDVFRQLVQEMREETGLTADPDPGPIVAITIDPVASSADLVMHVELTRPVEEIVAHTDRSGQHGWEYETTRWIACHELGRFVDEMPCIPPTAALAGLVAGLWR